MTRMISNILSSFGNLLDLAPHGRTSSRSRLDKKQAEVARRNDKASISADFSAVGSDINSAMKKWKHG